METMKEITLKELDNLSSTEIDDLKTKAEVGLQTEENALAVIEQEILKLQKKKLETQLEIKVLDMTAAKGRNNVRLTRSRIKILNSKFWSAKQSGT